MGSVGQKRSLETLTRMSFEDHLLNRLASIDQIVIIGASGWIGRETIALLQELLVDDFQRRVILVGSRDSTISVNGQQYHVRRFADIPFNQPIDLIIHLAFLTQDRALALGMDTYAQLNRELSDSVYQLCRNSKTKFVLVASSGAAEPRILSNYSDPSKKLYGQLKRESEELFLRLVGDQGAKVAICRIWSISGSQLQDPGKYALGNFIMQAKFTNKIKMESAGRIERAYVDAGQMMKVMLSNLLDGHGGILDSGGTRTTLSDLAKLILLEFNRDGEIEIPSNAKKDSDFYVPEINPFNNLARESGLSLHTLEEQIKITAKGQVFQ